MKRLVYAPKAYIFIRSSNLDGRIFNVTSDVVSGSVTRNVNDVSSAEFVLRNRFFKYLYYRGAKGDPNNGKSLFLPMDMVTIWLQRIAGKPIQVFTGYLDSVPYYQLYPGNCRITASCTLKRLAYQWFDPGLDFFHNWLQQEGWFHDPTTGEATNIPALTEFENVQNNELGDTKRKVNDGGFAKLLYDFMTQIAGWQKDDVIVSRLPESLPRSAAKLYSDINTQTKLQLKSLEEDLRKVMGVQYVGMNETNPDSTSKSENEVIAQKVWKVAGEKGIDPALLLAIAIHNTKLDPNYNASPATGSHHYALYGFYGTDENMKVGGKGNLAAFIAERNGGNVSVKEVMGHVERATEVAANVLLRGPSVPSKKSGLTLKQANDWAQVSSLLIAPNITQAEWDQATKLAKNAAAEGSGHTTGNPNPSSNAKTKGIGWQSQALIDKLDAADQQVLKFYQNGPDALASILFKAKAQSDKLFLSYPADLNGPKNPNVIYIAGDAREIGKFVASFKNEPQVELAAANYNDGLQRYVTIRRGVVSTQVDSNVPSNTVKVYTTEASTVSAPKTNSTTQTQTGDVTQTPQFTFEDLARFSANAIFAAKFSFPVNYLESHHLVGNKSLMNDVSCLDAVKQFCSASMRNFMSLPDGRFVAFYPDYFGAHKRKPYWWISDIEIINMGIQLNDQALATHVYVTGDTFALDGQIDAMDRISTRGVATLTQAAILHGFLDTDDKNSSWGRLADAANFLEHYGARPHKEETPIIRNTFFEFLLAWQRFMQLWAGQFQTSVQFTFQPEVFAGGIIGFPEHNLQMYVEGVTHRWDYANGFFTDATLSSPALLKPDPYHKHPGFALAGNVNTVAAGNLG